MHLSQTSKLGYLSFKPNETNRQDRTELKRALASLGARKFATSSRQLQTVSSEIKILNRSSETLLGVRSFATCLQYVVRR